MAVIRSRILRTSLLGLSLCSVFALTVACGDSGDDTSSGDGDGDATTPGDGDGDMVGGGDGDGDGDGDTGGTAGDGDGDTGGTPGDGDGDITGPGLPGDFNCSPAEGDVPTLGLEQIVRGDQVTDPLLVTFAPNDERLFVVEQPGTIKIIDGDTLLGTDFLDIRGIVTSGGEQGLLGLAFHPNYATNGLFYVHYSDSSGDTAIAEYSVSAGDPNVADPGSARMVLTATQPADNHNGGTIQFGPDGMLHIFLGDGGGWDDIHGHGQNQMSLLGAHLRIDVDARDAGEYGIPSGNLSEVLDTALPEIASYGLRNPYRANFDVCTGGLFVGDVGQDDWEEVTVSPPGEFQLNYGWPIMEGDVCFDSATCDQMGLTIPQIAYPHPPGDGFGPSVVGGAVYRGSEIPGLRGQYIYSDTSIGTVWLAEYDAATSSVSAPVELPQTFGNPGTIVSIQNGNDGEVYMTSLWAGIYKVVTQ